MSRLRYRLAVPSLLALPVVLAGCVRIAVRTDVGADGSLKRRVSVEADAALTAERLAQRFGPSWTVTTGAGGKSFAAERTGAPPGAPNPTAVAVEVREGLFFTEYRFAEDLRPAPHALRPGGTPLFRPLLADDTSLELLYRMASERIEVRLELLLPGRPIEGNWQRREPGGTFIWEASLRTLPALHARTRVLHPLPILAATSGLGIVLLGSAWRITRSRREP